jgi:hypothetical protein
VARALPLRRLPDGLQHVRRGPRPRAAGARPGHALSTVRHLAPHGASRLPERCAGRARGELQQPRELRGVAVRRAHPALSAVRRDRYPQRRRYRQLAEASCNQNRFYGTIRPSARSARRRRCTR